MFKILYTFYCIFDFIFKSGYVYKIPRLSGEDVVDKNVRNEVYLVEREKITESATELELYSHWRHFELIR